jgi:hypothetical protein
MTKVQNVDITWAKYMFDYLQDVGDMTDMHRQVNALRFGSSGAIGNMIDNSLRSGLESYRLFFMSNNNYTTEEYSKIIDDVVFECVRNHSYFNYYCCWGRKPLLDYDHSNSACPTIVRKQSGSTTTSGGNRSFSIATTGSTLDESLHSTPPVPNVIYGNSIVDDEDDDDDNHEVIMVEESTDYSAFPWKPHQDILLLDPNDGSEIADLGSESVDDIDQFVEGFMD